MNILVVSDTHFLEQALEDLVNSYRDQVDIIVHCGDSQLPATHPVWERIDYVVKGNCDSFTSYKKDVIFSADQLHCYVTHGHLFDVNYSLNQLAEEAHIYGCHIAFYGHTHITFAEKVSNVICINPGSLKQPRGHHQYKTFAIIQIEEHGVTVNFYDDKYNQLSHLQKTFEI